MAEHEFNPGLLKWARERRFGPNFEVLVEQWSPSWKEVSSDLIRRWERGEEDPSFGQVKKLAEIYKRPLAVFFLDNLPEESPNPPDLRTIGSKDSRSLSPRLLLAFRRARRIQSIASDLFTELGQNPRFDYKKYSLQDDPIKLAEAVRENLAISTAEQFTSKKYEDFFEYLRGKIEGTGVITLKSGLHESFPTSDCRAFSFNDSLPYLILVNNKDSEGAKNFSLLHEFCHLLLGTQGICNNFGTFGMTRGVNEVEVFCNQFAASFLVPANELLRQDLIVGRNNIPEDETDEIANQLAFRFKVSRFVILRRFLALDLVSLILFRKKSGQWEKEPVHKSKPGGRYSLKTVLGKNGSSFSSLVLSAYRNKKLSYASVADYLGIKTKNLSTFERLIDSHAR